MSTISRALQKKKSEAARGGAAGGACPRPITARGVAAAARTVQQSAPPPPGEKKKRRREPRLDDEPRGASGGWIKYALALTVAAIAAGYFVAGPGVGGGLWTIGASSGARGPTPTGAGPERPGMAAPRSESPPEAVAPSSTEAPVPTPLVVRVEFATPTPSTGAAGAQGGSATSATPPAIATPSPGPTPRPRTYVNPEFLRRELETYKVEGISWDPVRPAAIVNGKIYEPGQRIQDALIKRIEKNHIVIELRGEEYIIQP
jgi:hypothetical protein